MKKCLFALLILSFFIQVKATTYYISSAGNDANSGTTGTPGGSWQTLAKVNSTTFSPGDIIAFHRGDVFYGSLVIHNSGSTEKPIIFGAYGTGTKPVITGFKSITGFIKIGKNLWEAFTGSALPTCNLVVINGINTAMGRSPNGDNYYNIDSQSPNVITSTSLTTNWTENGTAKAVIKTGYASENVCSIVSQSVTTITVSDPNSRGNFKNDFGFFIQNDIRTLDQQNEWFYDPSTQKIYIYSTSMPVDVKVATVTDMITNAGNSNININNLTITGGNNDLLNFSGKTSHISINNDSLVFCGNFGWETRAGNFDSLYNCQVRDMGKSSTQIIGTNAYVGYNTMYNCGVLHGQSDWNLRNAGIYVTGGGGHLIEHNIVKNAGSHGICIGTSVATAIVQYNFVDSSLLTNSDNGGIYKGGVAAEIVIDHNIVLHSVGFLAGTPQAARTGYDAVGIYLDEGATHVVVTNNTVAGCGAYGLKLHSYSNNTPDRSNTNSNRIENNTFFNNAVQAIITNENSGLAMNADTFRYNICFAYTSSQLAFRINDNHNAITNIGLIDYNYYIRPLANSNFIIHQTGGAPTNSTLSDWQAVFNGDMHSVGTPLTTSAQSDLVFLYNATNSATTTSLASKYIDAKNVGYNGTITLQPFTSVVLIKNR